MWGFIIGVSLFVIIFVYALDKINDYLDRNTESYRRYEAQKLQEERKAAYLKELKEKEIDSKKRAELEAKREFKERIGKKIVRGEPLTSEEESEMLKSFRHK
jgi:uncharacterized membrane protein YhiD involved in acid resistance